MKHSNEFDTFLLMADLSGYTAMTEAHGAMSAAQIVNTFEDMVNLSLRKDTQLMERVGDEVLLFSTSADEIIDTGKELLEKCDNETNFPLVHIGMHFGKVLEQKGHFFGSALNIASRIAAYARGGQILCSEVVVEQVESKTSEFVEMGPVKFKNVSGPVEIYKLSINAAMEGEIRAMDPVCRMQVHRNHSPACVTYDGKTYHFCSDDCARKFTEGPELF